MKKLFVLLIPVLAFTAGCAAITPANTNTTTGVNTNNATVSTNTNTVAVNANTNATASVRLHTNVPSGWESVTPWQAALDLRHNDPELGYRESEIGYPNQGYFVAQIFGKGTSGFTESDALLNQAEKRTIVGDANFPVQSEVTSEESITVVGLQGKRYFISRSTQDNSTHDFVIETLLRYDENTIIDLTGAYGDGSDSAQLKADVLTIEDSLTVTK